MTPSSISPETNLKALFTRWPATIPVFLHHRMNCVGCSMSVFDTLQEAADNYGLPVSPFLAELQAAIDRGRDSTVAGSI
ncbi:MAG TPA: DUF1858 domain-containing protein [Anaerolineaceae bacterium]|nr:DUF1858 domain-containing protein [Anaerolineaceae bacterium]